MRVFVPFSLIVIALCAIASAATANQAEIQLPNGLLVTQTLAEVNDLAKNAELKVFDQQRISTLERSQKRRFRTRADGHQPIAVAATSDDGEISGMLVWNGHSYTISGRVSEDGIIRISTGESHDVLALRHDVAIELQEDSIPTPAHIADLASGHALFSLRGAGPVAEAVIAVDTDNEFLASALFNNNTSLAVDWIADMFNAINVVYERDLGLTLLQGETILRVGNNDPWNVSGSPATQSHLNEFGSWWQQNQAGIDRTFALLLSGKSSSQNSASGIAWVDGYCENQSIGGGYSINQVFTNPGFGAAFSSKLVAHELGHNLGSIHTHCYTPEIDQCFNAEPGCFTGTPVCPASGDGTLMSYCNFGPPAGANCGQTDYEFAPRVIDLITTRIADELISGCLTTLNPVVFADSFESVP